MKVPQEITDRIKKYLKGDLNEEERTSFEALLKKDPALQEEVNFTRSLIQETGNLERQRLIQVIQNAESPVEQPALASTTQRFLPGLIERIKLPLPKLTTLQRRSMAVAAVVSLMILGWWWFFPRTNALEQFQELAYISPNVSEIVRGRSASPSNILSQAYRAYDSGNYQQSLAYLKDLSEEDSLFLLAKYLEAHNEFQLGAYENAILSFQEILDPPATKTAYIKPNLDNAGWTQIVAQLSLYNSDQTQDRKTELEQALKTFLSNANPTDTYYQKATQLQALLNR